MLRQPSLHDRVPADRRIHPAGRRTAPRRALIWAAAAVLATPVPGSAGHILSVDPLASAPPAGIEVLLPRDGRPAGAKLMRSLASKAITERDGSELSLIVTLHTPRAATLGEKQGLEQLHALQHQFAARAAGVGAYGLRGLQSFPIVFARIHPSQLLELAALPEVRAIEEDEIRRGFRTQGAGLMKATTLRTTYGGNGNGVAVAVLDSGVDAAHPELASRVVAWGNFTAGVGDGRIDMAGHGTGVAGIIAGTAAGVAPQANIWSIKVLGDDNSGSDASILAGLDAVYGNRTNFGGVDLVNMSLGGGGPFNSHCDAVSPSYATVVDDLVSAGIAVFVASGNEAFLNGIAHPACLSNAIAVGAVYDADNGPLGPYPIGCSDSATAADQITCYSNSGVPLDVLGPAECAHTPAPGGGYDNCFGGTSSAAPYTAGVAAQILSLLPALTPQQLAQALIHTGRPRLDVNGITRNRVDAVAAYLAATGAGDPPPPYATWITSPSLPGYRVQVRITGGGGSVQGKGENDCIAETICLSGALAGRPEVFVKVVGPRPNGFLWVQGPRFTPSKVEIWVQKIGSGQINYYVLDAASPGNLSGLEDREAFLP
ncbi:MAG TPA: S8 family serine peptidase [Thermoanaerobaculia bacterium]|nr:S8 family serine peptidase [Thermoanaerobaculia bacterium]